VSIIIAMSVAYRGIIIAMSVASRGPTFSSLSHERYPEFLGDLIKLLLCIV